MNSQFQAVLKLSNKETPPIWFMRQAGRYHQHYQKLRKDHSFLELCRKPQLAAEVALGPIMDFDFDTAILFSDILFPLEALGRDLDFTDAGPKLGPWADLTQFNDCRSLSAALEKMSFQGEAMKQTRALLPSHKSLVGFVGGPWTLFTYWIEESHKGPLLESKRRLSIFNRFMEILEPLLLGNIKMQLAHGAEVVNIFDTSAGELSPELFDLIVTPTLKKLANAFPKQILYYSRGTQPAHFQNDFWRKESPLLGVGVDHRWNLFEAFELFQGKVIQGNFDQTLLFQTPEEFQAHFKKFVQNMKTAPESYRSRWIAGLGHGVLPKTPEENVRWAVKYLHEVWS